MNITLRGALTATIVALGIAGILLGLYIGGSYRSVAYANHADALRRVIALETRDELSKLETLQKELGFHLQKEQSFRNGLHAADTRLVQEWFNQEFHRYFVTTGLLKLRQLVLYDKQFKVLVSSTAGEPFPVSGDAPICPFQWRQLAQRKGPLRLKPSVAYCVQQGRFVGSVVVAVGGLRLSGYLQLVVDPVHNLTVLREALGMPLRIVDADGGLLHQSNDWPPEGAASMLPVSYPLLAEDGGTGVVVTMASDLTAFDDNLDARFNRVLLTACALLAITVLIALLILGRGLRPLKQLQRAADAAAEGRFEPVEKHGHYQELNAVIGAFNHMVAKLDAEQRNRELAERGLTQAKLVAEKQAELMFVEKEFSQVTLESIIDGVITTDTDCRIRYMNPMAQQLTGWDESEASQKKLTQVFRIVGEDGSDPLQQLVDGCLQGEAGAQRAQSALLVSDHVGPLPVDLAAAAMMDRQQQVIGMVLVFNDVSEARELTRQLSYAASHDALTGLINRYEFERRVGMLLADVGGAVRVGHHLGYIDLDQFKLVNDTCGHVAGDALLRQITGLLGDVIRQSDTLARLGGDEFGLLLPGCDLEHGLRVSHQICDAVRDFRFVWEDHTFTVGCSLGLVGFGDADEGLASVLRAADSACYAAKEAGGNRVQVYHADDQELQQRHGEMHWVSRITDGLEQNSFALYAQPIMALRGNEVLDLEVLVRFVGADGAIVNPGAFLPAAERYRLSTRIDRWVIRSVLEVLSARGQRDGGLRLAVNLSGSSLADREFLHFVEDELARSEVDPARLIFEVTETNAIANLIEAHLLMAELKKLGCRFALDDFGSGLSSFAYLKNLPVDILKIDGVFVRNIVDDPMDEAMVRSINEVGHVMGMTTVAEFVDSDAIIEKLTAIGVDYAQGYHIDKPAPLAQQLNKYGA